MNHITKRNGNIKISTLCMVFVFVLFSNSSIFAQSVSDSNSDSATSIEKTELVNTTVEMNSMKQQATSVDSNMNFILWFMGSNQNPNSSLFQKESSTKKQFMSSGTEPNRLLIKAFLKKVVNFENAAV